MLLFFALPNLNLFTSSSQSKKEFGCATPKENINRISAIFDEDHFLVFLLTVLSTWDTAKNVCLNTLLIVLKLSEESQSRRIQVCLVILVSQIWEKSL